MSLISREAADQLGLAPGVLVEAATKATNVAVEAAADTRQGSDGEETPSVAAEEE